MRESGNVTYRLLSSEKGPAETQPRYFLNCLWRRDKTASYYNPFPVGYLNNPLKTYFFSPSKAQSHLTSSSLAHVRHFKIDGYSQHFDSLHKPDRYRDKYQFLFILVDPRILPQLEVLELDCVKPFTFEKSFKTLRHNLQLFKNSIKVRLALDRLEDVRKVIDCGLHNYVDELTVKVTRDAQTDDAYYSHEVDSNSNPGYIHKFPKLQKLALIGDTTNFSREAPIIFSMKSELFSNFFGLHSTSCLTYLDISDCASHPMDTFWFPSSVTVLKVNLLFLQTVNDEETAYRRFENVTSLTIVTDDGSYPTTSKLCFRNLIDFYVVRSLVENVSSYSQVLRSADAVVDLLNMNQRTLRNFGIELFCMDEFTLYEPYVQYLQKLELSINAGQKQLAPSQEHILTRALRCCGSQLMAIRCQVGPAEYLETSRTPHSGAYIDYPVLRELVLNKCPNLKFNISAESFNLPTSVTLDQEAFFKGFDESEDSKHFSISDFCCRADPRTFLLLGESYNSFRRRYIDSAKCQMFMDFEKLRALIYSYKKIL